MMKKVLVVDDSVVVRQIVSVTLRSAGYATVEAVDGKDGMRKLREHDVSMIVTDLNMPEMDGISFIREVRSTDGFRGMPIVMLTTVSQEERKLEGKMAGASGWIYKPFSGRQLVETVRKFL